MTTLKENLVSHRSFTALPAAGAFASGHAVTSIVGTDTAGAIGRLDLTNGGKLAVTIKYTANVAAVSGYPGFYVAWQKRIDDGTAVMSYDQTPLGTVTPDANDAPILCYRTRVECNGLTDASAEYADYALDVPPWAVGVRVEPAEIGDTANPGTCGIWLGRAL